MSVWSRDGSTQCLFTASHYLGSIGGSICWELRDTKRTGAYYYGSDACLPANNWTVDYGNVLAPTLAATVISDELKTALQNRLDEIGTEQERIRRNMGQLNRDSDLYKKYVEKLTQQEDEFNIVRREREQMDGHRRQLTGALNEYIRGLNVK